MSLFLQDLREIYLPALPPSANGVSGLLQRYLRHRRIQAAGLPLLLRRPGPRRDYRRVLVPTDFSAAAADTARLALRAPVAMQVTFLHAYLNPKGAHDAACGNVAALRLRQWESAREGMLRFCAGLDDGRTLLSTVVHYGSPQQVVISYVRRMRADLVLLPYLGITDLLPPVRPSMLDYLVHRTGCDILLTCPPSADRDTAPRARGGAGPASGYRRSLMTGRS